jgi:uncharacterized protein (TIGR00369 family)
LGVSLLEQEMALDAKDRDALLDRIRRIPIVETLRIHIDEFGEGYCRAVVRHERRYDGVYDSFHGGLLMTVADSIACFAIMTKTGHDRPMTTTDMNIRFLAPCLTDVTGVAKVIKFGRTLCPVAVELFDARGTQVAVAQVTYMLLSKAPNHIK